jgi:hypothetical protein
MKMRIGLTIATIALVACSPIEAFHEASYASFQRPNSVDTVTVGLESYAVLTFTAVPRGLGSCNQSAPCEPSDPPGVMTEVFALGQTPIFTYFPDTKAFAAEIARSLRCPDAPEAHLSADFVGIGIDDFGAWQFFGLCPGDYPD